MKKTTKTAVTVSWRTTVGGICAGVGCALIALAVLPDWGWSHPQWVKNCGVLGLVLNSFGVMFMGVFGRDHSVTSDQAKGTEIKA